MADQYPAYGTAPQDANVSLLALRISRLEGRATTLEGLVGTIATGPDSFPGGISFLGSLSSPTGIIQLGANPGSIGAINVDASSYGNVAFRAVNGTADFRIIPGASTATQLGDFGSQGVVLVSANLSAWEVTASSGTCTLIAEQTTARIVGGSSNGLSIWNSGNTRANFNVNDAGNVTTWTDGTRSFAWRSNSASGEMRAGAGFLGADSGCNTVWRAGDNTGASGLYAQIIYYNQTQYYAALEVANVASGFGTLALMKSGGSVVVGTDTGGAQLVRIGGAIQISSAVLISTKTSFTNNAGAGAGTLTNAPSAGNPTKWIPVDDNGTTRNIPAW